MSAQQKMHGETRLPQAYHTGDPNQGIRNLAIKLSDWLYEIKRRVNLLIAGEFGLLQLEMRTAAPSADELKDGTIAYADGTTWNPGSGKGLYRYDGTAWNFLG